MKETTRIIIAKGWKDLRSDQKFAGSKTLQSTMSLTLQLFLTFNMLFTQIFWLQQATEIIKSHDPSNPLFMYMAFQNCHGPVQAPEKYTEKYSFITDETRRTYAGMVSITDEAIGNITQTMKDAGYGPFFSSI